MPSEYHVTLDATRDPALRSPEVLVNNLSGLLNDICDRPEPPPREITLDMIAPDGKDLQELERNLEKLNRVIQPRGFMDNIAHAAFRGMSGIKGDLHPIAFERGTGDPNRLNLRVDLTGLSREDLVSFAAFLQKNAHRIPR